jgi:DNA polymerase I-like protein with 3'-5' exonuclease and polymerase domains
MAMVNTMNWPDWMRLILSVHDELVVIAPRNRAEEGIELLEQAMLADNIVSRLKVPLKVDIKAVDRWSEAK